jgi:hypothetical protein
MAHRAPNGEDTGGSEWSQSNEERRALRSDYAGVRAMI